LTFIDDLLNTLAAPLKAFATNSPPEAIIARALIVLGAAFVLSLTSTLANRFLVNYKMVNSYRKEYMSWMKSVNKARKEGDEKQLDKLMRRQGAVMKMNTRASLETLKTMPFYWYLICSFTISIPLSKIFGVNAFSMGGSGGDSK